MRDVSNCNGNGPAHATLCMTYTVSISRAFFTAPPLPTVVAPPLCPTTMCMTSVDPAGDPTIIVAEVSREAAAAGLPVELDSSCSGNSTDASYCSKCLRVVPQLRHAASIFQICF